MDYNEVGKALYAVNDFMTKFAITLLAPSIENSAAGETLGQLFWLPMAAFSHPLTDTGV